MPTLRIDHQHTEQRDPSGELSPHRPLRVECNDEKLLVTLGDRSLSDLSVIADLDNLALCTGDRQFTINLINVRYLNGGELGRIVLHKQLQTKGRRLAIVNANAIIQQILGVTRLDLLLEKTPAHRRTTKIVA